MADRCFTLLSLIVRLISNLIPCFQRPSAQYKPTPKKMKDGANLLFRGVIVDLAQQRTSVWCRAILFIPDLAFCRPESFSLLLRKVSKTHASMQARAVGLSFKSYVFKSIHRIGVDGWKRCENVTCGRELFGKRKKKRCVFKRIMLRVEGALEYKKKNNALAQCFVSGCTVLCFASLRLISAY